MSDENVKDVPEEPTNNLPVSYEDELAAAAREAAALERPQNATISCKGGVLKYGKDKCADNQLQCIIVTDRHTRRYFEEEQDDDNPQNPVCWAYSQDNGKTWAAHPESSKPQSETGNCRDCWANQYETALKGKGKACTERRTLVVMPAGVTAEEVPTAEMARLDLTPTSSREDYPRFLKTIAAVLGLPPQACYTTIGTVPDDNAMYRLTFKAGCAVVNGATKVPVEIYRAIKARTEEAVDMVEIIYEPNPELTEEQKMAKEAMAEQRAARGKKLGGKK